MWRVIWTIESSTGQTYERSDLLLWESRDWAQWYAITEGLILVVPNGDRLIEFRLERQVCYT